MRASLRDKPDRPDRPRTSKNIPRAQTFSTPANPQLCEASAILKRALRSWEKMTAVSPRHPESASDQINALRDLRLAFTEIMRVSNFVRDFRNDQSTGLEPALANYRESLAQFRLQLPRIQGWLLVERARLASRHAHSASVQEWIAANRQTR